MARFQPGQDKPQKSGRKKGVPNRKTALLQKSLDELGHELPTRILELLPELSTEKQVDVYLELMQYIFPKRKALEHQDSRRESNSQVVLILPKNGREAVIEPIK